MLDINFIRQNPEVVKAAAKNKNIKVDVDELLAIDGQVLKLKQQLDTFRQKRNENSEKMKGGKPSPEVIEQGKKLKDQIAALETELKPLEEELLSLMHRAPNLMAEDVPIGKEGEGVVISSFGTKKDKAKDHLDLAESKDWVDFSSGAKVAGSKFYYLKGDLALLENAIYQFALNLIVEKGFIFVTVPHMVNQKTAMGTGFAPRSDSQNDEYFIEGEDLALIATAEVSLTGLHTDSTFEEDQLPVFYAGYSPCYRKEAGTYGKHTRGLFRVHQFNKLEMYAYSLPEKSLEVHEYLKSIEEEIWQKMNIPYRVVNIPSGDLGSPAFKKYDIEYWSPVDNEYRELTSCSNCTDFQARNLNIKLKRKNGSLEFVHTLNGTAVSLSRTLVAFIENHQNEDGSINIPSALKLYMGGREKI
ncbi:MAG TPA: serine--tRNA ligase [Candidatus Saccharibacteria bacterium]|jgi:seryl-tRNA synthetase|nr:serine--tRNA ligase [Candidatus Saccharibacteria bacterium]